MRSVVGQDFYFSKEKKNSSMKTILICFFLHNKNYKYKSKSLFKHLIIIYVNK